MSYWIKKEEQVLLIAGDQIRLSNFICISVIKYYNPLCLIRTNDSFYITDNRVKQKNTAL
jgi:hypothetical protein